MLPVLLRKLIRSTGMDLRRLDFPGYDNAERKGWDGLVEAGAATPWIPNGKSCWEFSTRRDIGRKANGDYATRTRSVSAEERSECTFVFVTARNWQGKNAWESSKDSSGEWESGPGVRHERSGAVAGRVDPRHKYGLPRNSKYRAAE